MENTKNVNIMDIPAEKFQPATGRDTSHDKKLDTKPISAFKDAWLRFCKNKGSIAAFVIIIILVLFSIVVPIFSQYTVAYDDLYFKYNYPRNELCVKLGWDFWDGCAKKTLNETTFLEHTAIGMETGDLIIKNNKYTVRKEKSGNFYTYRMDSYHTTGIAEQKLTLAEFQALQAYQDERNIQIIYPAIGELGEDAAGNDFAEKYPQYKTNVNIWFKMVEKYATNADGTVNKKKKVLIPDVYDKDGNIIYDDDGNIAFKKNYIPYSGLDDENLPKDRYTSKMLIEGENREYNYAVKKNGDCYVVRVNYYEYYIYMHTQILKDGIDKPSFLFGTTQAGKDIFTCLGAGARLSFLLAISVSAVNMLVGAIYGSIEGYYGGKLDLFMERFSDILAAVPFMIVITLLKLHMGNTSQLTILFIAFFLTGWIGMASRVRMQFYRFKNQEYVLAARTLGARDSRIMLRHIFPNSLGTIITGSVLSIPGMIFSESSLSYLGIINLQTGSMTSVGNLLSSAQPYLTTYPYMMLFPGLFICLLMLSFNLFGNGLRDAFNPSLRGAED